MDTNKQRQAAKAFAKEWSGKGYEKGETQRFWLSLLHNVFGIDDPTKLMEFEIPVKTILKEKGSDFIDGYISGTKVLIEQKGSHVDLAAKYRQSDGTELTPYQQARRYAAGLPHSMSPRWIVAFNFSSFEVHDMEHPSQEPEVIQLSDLETEYHRLHFLVDETSAHIKKELEVSIQAGEIVGVLYEKFLAQYKDPSNPFSQKSLNKLCVRLVFCLYAEDSGIFGTKDMFHDYMAQFSAGEFREKLIKLFRILDTKPEDRDPYEDEQLLAFPFVSGGMFTGDIEIPRITDEIRTLILQRASDDFNWSLISPTIFGAVFESTLNPDTRRAGGMHYTSIENIHKVIDPLFLDDLKAELAAIKAISVVKTRRDKALAFQEKLAGLKFLDPACGSGNFLTESFTSLRRLENEALKIIYGGDRMIGEMADPIKVTIEQFYGIEINDFACSVTQTALWIAETQMLLETDAIVGYNLEPLPLKNYTNIHEGNALRMDWNDVVPASELNYIMGNPPFIGQAMRSKEQTDDLKVVFAPSNDYGKLDYVTGWFKKAADLMKGSSVEAAFVSSNSICQGELVNLFWQKLLADKLFINFAHTTFLWTSEAKTKAAVMCVIVGFSYKERYEKLLYVDGILERTDHINGYLKAAPDVYISNRSKSINEGLAKVVQGSPPADDGKLLFSVDEKNTLIHRYPELEEVMLPFVGSREFINDTSFTRYCLWLVGKRPSDYAHIPELTERFKYISAYRMSSPVDRIQKTADRPYLFTQNRQPDTDYLFIPRVSSSSRRYIPVGFMPSTVIASDAAVLVNNATIYDFGIISSSTHNAWMRVVAGRLKNDYRYAPSVYYNYPFPKANDEQKKKVEASAYAILEARKLYADKCLADMYGENMYLFPELLQAHRANDAAVLEAYGFPKDATESDIVARLFKMYQILTENK